MACSVWAPPAAGMAGENELYGPVTEREAKENKWPSGLLPLLNDSRRARRYAPWFSELPTDVERFAYRVESMEDVNALVRLLAEAYPTRRPTVEISARAGASGALKHDPLLAAELWLGNQSALDRWFHNLDADGRRKFGVRQPPTAAPATLTIFAGHAVVDLGKLVVPPSVLVTTIPGERPNASLSDAIRKVDRFMAEYDAGRRGKTLTGMRAVMGDLPDRSNLPAMDLKVSEVARGEGYERRTVSFANVYGERVTAYLYVPSGLKAGERRPGVLALQPTGEAGKVIVDGKGPKTFGRAYALEMAMRGYVVIAPDYPSFGEQRDYDFKKSKYASGTMKAISDNMRCVDLLRSMPEVDGEKIAAIGHSLGGHNALFTAAFDERIKVAMTSCGWTPFRYYYGGKKLANWAQDRYMPRVRDVYASDPGRMPFDFPGIIEAIVPRAVFSNSPTGDENFDVAGVVAAEPEIRAAYERAGARDKFVVRHPGYGHDFGEAERREAYRFIDRQFGFVPVREVP